MSETEENMMTRPMVSVVMIAYNKADVIADAIEGVARQRTDFPVELIIMDDCSTDETAEVVKKYYIRYPGLIRYFRNEHNLGLQGNYLEGFKKCRGRYMAICDADDYWCCRSKLRRQVEYMENNRDCAITFHRVINYYEADGELSLSNGGQKADTTIDDLSRSNYITNLSVMYRRELVDLENLPAWILDDRSPDYAMHILYAMHGPIHYFKRPMGVYRKAAGSSWSMTDEFTRLKMSLTVRQHLLEQVSSFPKACEGLRMASENIIRAMARCAASEDQRAETLALAKAVGIDASTLSFGAGKPKAVKRGMLSRIRGMVSRLIPVPRP